MTRDTTPPARPEQAIDVGTRPPRAPEPDAGLAYRLAPEQAAIRDAPLIDVAGLLQGGRALPISELVATRRDQHRAEAAAQTDDNIRAVHARAVGLAAGSDSSRPGMSALAARALAATADEVPARNREAETRRRVVAQGGVVPVPVRGLRPRLLVQRYLLPLASVVVEWPLIAAALSVATRAESQVELYGLALISCLGLTLLPHLAGEQLHALRAEEPRRRWRWGVVVAAGVVWVAFVITLASARTAAARHAVEAAAGTAGGFVTAAGQTVAGEDAAAGTGSEPLLWVLFAALMVAMSVANLIHAVTSSTPEKLEWLPAEAARVMARAARIAADQSLDSLRLMLAHLAEEEGAVAAAGHQHIEEVLPMAARHAVPVYLARLAQEVGDPALFDALRLTDRTLPLPEPVSDPRERVPEPLELSSAALSKTQPSGLPDGRLPDIAGDPAPWLEPVS